MMIKLSPLDLPRDPTQCVHVEIDSHTHHPLRCLKNSDRFAINGWLCTNHNWAIQDQVKRRTKVYFADRDREMVEQIITTEKRALAHAEREVVRLTVKGLAIVYCR